MNIRTTLSPISLIVGAAISTCAPAQTLPPSEAQPTRIASAQRWRPAGTVDTPGQNGAALIEGQVAAATIGPAVVRRAYRAIESRPDSVLEKSTIAGIVATDLQRDGIRLRTANDVTIRDFDLTMRAQPQRGKHLPEGIAITAGRNIVIRDGRVRGFRMVDGKGYTNGDGIATEGETQGRILNVSSGNNSDGGFDIKGDWRLDDLVAERNGRDYRFWNTISAGTLTANGWSSAAVWAGKGARVRIEHLIATNTTLAPLLIVAGGTDVTIVRCTLSRPAGAQIVKSEGSNNKVSLGPGCNR
ncbi:right-handed parallel beta-helix repeat-containing protein [Sphingomonas sp. 2R-10]|uniref:right-handed parallel beta-helix repeat-containing protein n=1 Tax=Sphingomonas sp. 2R-10 TaxID=3045148 RepID=UPI0013DDB824|nr:right-handed parallel beta-helix repeat-containing protein [Sphingomonas sp. 2R-10]MDJ0275589.1 right-handed parallel beta-helix repeat-containing protein [Sphingomonas sp. 2R-10]